MVNKYRDFPTTKVGCLSQRYYLLSIIEGKSSARSVATFFRNRNYKVRVTANSPVRGEKFFRVWTRPEVLS